MVKYVSTVTKGTLKKKKKKISEGKKKKKSVNGLSIKDAYVMFLCVFF